MAVCVVNIGDCLFTLVNQVFLKLTLQIYSAHRGWAIGTGWPDGNCWKVASCCSHSKWVSDVFCKPFSYFSSVMVFCNVQETNV